MSDILLFIKDIVARERRHPKVRDRHCPIAAIACKNSENLGSLYRKNTDKVLEIAKQALTLAQKTPNSSVEGLALLSLTKVYKVQGKYEQGIETAQKALEISRKIKNYGPEVAATVGLSEMYEALGEYQKVIAVAEPKLTQARKINKRDQEAQLLINLGNAYRLVGDYPKAQDLIQQGLKIARELKNPRLLSIALNNQGYYYTSIAVFKVYRPNYRCTR